ncbi:hypothetical protein PTSG_01312 [Salpingoeca rosetta]|uniref:Spindle and kinetochore-associated protein 1 n=1 Tax=Salpingoeca rosetta (strain ATCC 50818 / BSB-021) TaxID=946362 RepID=F2TZZ5_SALR5|nr:uncharacterized protein PTSG_01312 [Salpingoeca rosetta]EGD80723.1 hypothetical protein PTSG_01312 [Salpingoeca rosetta]|eukprot:XP_004997284.1 hypothetical protein PTSG_01312 [Salpingoeca rosetta]
MEALLEVFACRVRELKQGLVFLQEEEGEGKEGDVDLQQERSGDKKTKKASKRRKGEQLLGALWELDKSLTELEGRMDFVESKLDEEETEMEQVREYVTALQYQNERAHDALENLPKGVPNPPSKTKSKESAKVNNARVLQPTHQNHSAQQKQQQRKPASSRQPLAPITKTEFETLNPAIRKRLSLDRMNEVVEGIKATMSATHKGKKSNYKGFTRTDFVMHSGVAARDLARYMGALKSLDRITETHASGSTTYLPTFA